MVCASTDAEAPKASDSGASASSSAVSDAARTRIAILENRAQALDTEFQTGAKAREIEFQKQEKEREVEFHKCAEARKLEFQQKEKNLYLQFVSQVKSSMAEALQSTGLSSSPHLPCCPSCPFACLLW